MKTVLNIILILIAISSIVIAIVKSYPIELQFASFSTALACISATLAKKIYRYILAGIALALITISFFLQIDNLD